MRCIAKQGAKTVGVDPSEKLIALARERFPALNFRRTTFEQFRSAQTFDVVFCIMSIEHFKDLAKLFRKIQSHISPDGQVVILGCAYNTLARTRKGFRQEIAKGSNNDIAVCIDKGKAGTMYNILRTPESIIAAAQSAGLHLLSQRKYPSRRVARF